MAARKKTTAKKKAAKRKPAPKKKAASRKKPAAKKKAAAPKAGKPRAGSKGPEVVTKAAASRAITRIADEIHHIITSVLNLAS